MSQTLEETEKEITFPHAKKLKQIAQKALYYEEASTICKKLLSSSRKLSEVGKYSCKKTFPCSYIAKKHLFTMLVDLGYVVCFGGFSTEGEEIEIRWHSARENTAAYILKKCADAYHAEPDRVHREIYEEILPRVERFISPFAEKGEMKCEIEMFIRSDAIVALQSLNYEFFRDPVKNVLVISWENA